MILKVSLYLRATFSKHRAFGGRSGKIDLFHRYRDLSTKITVNKIRTDLNEANQEHERQNFTVKKYRSSNQQRERRNFTGDE